MTSPCSNAGFMLPLDRSGVLHNEFSPLFVRSAGMKGRYAEPQCLFPEAKPSPDVDLLKRYCQAFKTLLASHVKMEDVILSNKRRRRQSRDVEAMLKNLNEIVATPLKVRMSLGGAGDNVNLIERVAEPPAPASSTTGKSPLRKALTPTKAQDVNQRREKGWNSSSSSSKQSATAASPARSPARNSAITQRKSAQRRAGGAATPRLASTASLAKSSPALAAAAASRGRERAAAADPFTLYFSLTSTPGSGSKAVLPLSMPTPSDLIALQSVTEKVRQELQHTKAGPGSREEVEREGGVETDKEGMQRPLANTHQSSSSSSFSSSPSAVSPVRSPRALAAPRRSFGLGGSAVRLSSGGLKLGAKSPIKSTATGAGQRQVATMQRSPHRSPLRSPRPASASRVGLGLGFGSSAATKRATPAPSPRSPLPPAPASASASARVPGPGSARRALLQTADSLMAEIDSALMR